MTPRSVSQFWIFEKYSKLFRKINIWTPDSLLMETNKIVWICAVLACAESHISQISPLKRIFKKKKHFKLFIRNPYGFDSWKNVKTSRDTATLITAFRFYKTLSLLLLFYCKTENLHVLCFAYFLFDNNLKQSSMQPQPQSQTRLWKKW